MSACAKRNTPALQRATSTDLPPAITLLPTITPTPSKTPGAYPSRTPPVMCPNAPVSRLVVMERGRVTETEDGETLNMRTSPGTNNRIIVQMEQLETFFVLDGPVCTSQYTWYKVEYKGDVGWVAEGDADQYYAEPYLVN